MEKKDKLVNLVVRFNERSFIQILQQTMLILFPVAVVGSFAWIISDNLLSTGGFLANMFQIHRWVPQLTFFRLLFYDAQIVTIGWMSVYASFTAAYLTTRYYQRNNILAGITAIISYGLIFHHSIRGSQMIETRYFSVGWFIVGVTLGYLIGLIFVRWGLQIENLSGKFNTKQLMEKIWQNLGITTLILAGAFALHLVYAVWRSFNLDAATTQVVSSTISRNSNYVLNITLSLVNTILAWLGFAEPMNLVAGAYNNEINNNLTYALTHKTLANIPYPFTPSSLYNGFANFGGVGVTLALVIGILWVSQHHGNDKIARISIFPAIFNTGVPILFGAQVFLNPIYLIPFICLPILNMLIASLFIYFHVIPAVVYPILNGTPGILVPFIGTGGNWIALLASVILVIIDTIIYIPFIKFSFDVENRLSNQRGEQNGIE